MVNLDLGGVQHIGAGKIGGNMGNDEGNCAVEDLPLTSDAHDLPKMCQCQSLHKSPQFIAMCTHYV